MKIETKKPVKKTAKKTAAKSAPVKFKTKTVIIKPYTAEQIETVFLAVLLGAVSIAAVLMSLSLFISIIRN